MPELCSYLNSLTGRLPLSVFFLIAYFEVGLAVTQSCCVCLPCGQSLTELCSCQDFVKSPGLLFNGFGLWRGGGGSKWHMILFTDDNFRSFLT